MASSSDRLHSVVAVAFVAVQEDVRKVVVDAKLQGLITGACDRPAVGVMVFDVQPSCLGTVLEVLVVVGVASACVLDALDEVVIVTHLMQEGCNNFFDRAVESSCTDVDFMCAVLLGDPCAIGEGEVSVCFGGALNGDCRTGQLVVEVSVIETVEDLVEVACDAVVGGEFFHDVVPPCR